jgi:hypothetical protein
MGAYSKAIGTIIGAAVGAGFMWAASKWGGSCDAAGVCTVFGISSDVVTGIVLTVFGTIGTVAAPKNTNT